MKKLILDLCGGTGAWSKPYRINGYDVQIITLPEYNIFDYKPPNQVYGILAAPPCTEFSIAKGARPRDFEKGMETVKACLEIIWHFQKHGRLNFWALENPRGLLRRFLGVPKYTFEQWQFGGNKRKATDIWGYFNEPIPTVKLFPTSLVQNDGRSRAHAADWSLCEYPAEYDEYISQFNGDEKRAAVRAITPAGFAEAFYKANK